MLAPLRRPPGPRRPGPQAVLGHRDNVRVPPEVPSAESYRSAGEKGGRRGGARS